MKTPGGEKSVYLHSQAGKVLAAQRLKCKNIEIKLINHDGR